VSKHKYALLLLTSMTLVSSGASAYDAPQVLVKGKRDPSTVIVKGVRDPSDWVRIESQHLIVYSDDDPDQAIELVDNLEKLDHVLRLYLKPFMDEREALHKYTLYFRRSVRWPDEIGEHASNAVALADSCVSATQAFTFDAGQIWKLDNASLLRPEDNYTLVNNMWTYAENFLYRHTRIRGPAWFVTGFAAYFSGMRFTDTQMLVGRDGGTSYDLLQRIDEGGIRGLSFDDVLRHGAKPQSDKLDVKVGTPGYYRAWEFLGRSFNLVHYALSTEDNRSRLGTYLDSVADGANPADAFSSIFGIEPGDLDRTLWRYRIRDMKVMQVDMPDLPKAAIDLTRLSRIEGEFVVDNALLKTCPAPADGKKLLARLKTAAAKAPGVAFAQITLSRAQIAWGDPHDAVDYLAGAVESDSYDAEPHYLLGLADMTLAQGPGANRQALLAAARRSLMQAALLAPEAPEVSYALYRTDLMAAAPTEQGVRRAIDAWRHGRDVIPFARAAALAYAWLGDAAGAFQAFTTLTNEGGTENAAWAAAWLARLEQGVTRDALVAAMRTEDAAPPGTRRWMIDVR
jgi:hypothetical protein